MLDIIRARYKQGYKTHPFPKVEPTLPERFRGLPMVDQEKCVTGCKECADHCPTDAVQFDAKAKIDLGRCLFCDACSNSCPQGAIRFSNDYRLAARTRTDLLTDGKAYPRAQELDRRLRSLYGRALRLRAVSAGGCNGCEADINVLATIVFDLGRFGVQLVASPRHADGLIIAGPVTDNMRLALKKTYDAIATPKIVIAVGACAISGGPFANLSQVHNGADSTVPVDLYIPGCPPHPYTILDGILRLLGQRGENAMTPT